MKFDPSFIYDLTIQATKAVKAIRSIQALEAALLKNFPQPTTMTYGKNPYDLYLDWKCLTNAQVEPLREKLTTMLKIEAKWHRHSECWVCRGRVDLGGKANLNLHLTITPPWCGKDHQ